MAARTAFFVSKRFQRIAAAVICLMLAQAAAFLVAHERQSGGPVVRVAIEH